MKKALLSLVLTLAAVVMLFTGCGKNNSLTLVYDTDSDIVVNSVDTGLASVSAQGNSLFVNVNKDGTYNIDITVGDTPATVTVVCEKGSCTVSDNSGIQFLTKAD